MRKSKKTYMENYIPETISSKEAHGHLPYEEEGDDEDVLLFRDVPTGTFNSFLQAVGAMRVPTDEECYVYLRAGTDCMLAVTFIRVYSRMRSGVVTFEESAELVQDRTVL